MISQLQRSAVTPILFLYYHLPPSSLVGSAVLLNLFTAVPKSYEACRLLPTERGTGYTEMGFRLDKSVKIRLDATYVYLRKIADHERHTYLIAKANLGLLSHVLDRQKILTAATPVAKDSKRLNITTTRVYPGPQIHLPYDVDVSSSTRSATVT